MFKLLLSVLSGPLSSISNDIKEAYQSKLEAKNDSERIKAEERIKILEAQREVILKAQSDPWERFIRIGFALPCVLYIWKLIVWDKIFELGVTDDLSQNLWNIFFIVLGGYFIDTIIRKVKR